MWSIIRQHRIMQNLPKCDIICLWTRRSIDVAKSVQSRTPLLAMRSKLAEQYQQAADELLQWETQDERKFVKSISAHS